MSNKPVDESSVLAKPTFDESISTATIIHDAVHVGLESIFMWLLFVAVAGINNWHLLYVAAVGDWKVAITMWTNIYAIYGVIGTTVWGIQDGFFEWRQANLAKAHWSKWRPPLSFDWMPWLFTIPAIIGAIIQLIVILAYSFQSLSPTVRTISSDSWYLIIAYLGWLLVISMSYAFCSAASNHYHTKYYARHAYLVASKPDGIVVTAK
jgi:hypothetical protein